MRFVFAVYFEWCDLRLLPRLAKTHLRWILERSKNNYRKIHIIRFL